MFHFTTCLHEEEAHFIWVMLLWLTYKCFLSLDTAQEALMSSESRIQSEKMKVIAKGAIELFASLMLTTYSFKHYGPWLICSKLYLVAAIRTLFSGKFDLTLIMFVIAYQIQNFIVNLIDFAFF